MTASSPTPKSIVITGSKQGITNPPGAANPAYNASKAAIKNLTEHLAHDLRSDPATAHISVHLLIPGWTWTGLMGNVGPTDESSLKKMEGAWFPSQVAEELVKGMEGLKLQLRRLCIMVHFMWFMSHDFISGCRYYVCAGATRYVQSLVRFLSCASVPAALANNKPGGPALMRFDGDTHIG